MITQLDIAIDAASAKSAIRRRIANGTIKFAGYIPGKIYGMLSCTSGKRMKAENRVFFENEQEAIEAGYRPCGNCMPEKYREYKSSTRV
jgi:methylphosphotriester-DNA--protein-cysteine methyltransferase